MYWVDGGQLVGPFPSHLHTGSEVCGIGDVPVTRASQLAPLPRDIEHILEGLVKEPSVGDWSNFMAPLQGLPPKFPRCQTQVP